MSASYYISNLNGSVVVKDSSGNTVSATVEFGDYTKTSTNYAYKTVKVSGLPAGNYTLYLDITPTVYAETDDSTDVITCGAGMENIVKTDVVDPFKYTFDIWLKNIWQTTKLSTETDEEYKDRVWTDILGEDNEEAAVYFASSNFLRGEDYEFIISEVNYDTSQTYVKTNSDESTTTYVSEWRVTLYKSASELEAGGLYLPNTAQQGSAGDLIYFTGIELPQQYVEWAEESVQDTKETYLASSAFIEPTWEIELDKVRAEQELSDTDATKMINVLDAGVMFKMYNEQLIKDSHFLYIYIQTINLSWGEDDIIPETTFTLSDDVSAVINPVDTLEGEIETIKSTYTSSASLSSDVRSWADLRYLLKNGTSDISASPTKFNALVEHGADVQSDDFRSGSISGAGWGIRNLNGRSTLEIDDAVFRGNVTYNNLVINQISVQGGKEILSAAVIECTRVDDDDTGYICYFDQKQGSVGNLFQEDDVAYSSVYDADNIETKVYKRRVIATDVNSITLSKTDVSGSGLPAEGDVICHYGNYDNEDRRYVIVRDVIGGGNERMIMDLDSVTADGYEYYFAGIETGQNPRWQIGDEARGGMRVTVKGNTDDTNEVLIWADELKLKTPTGAYQNVVDTISVGGVNLYSTSTLEVGGIDSSTGGNITQTTAFRSSGYVALSGNKESLSLSSSNVDSIVLFYGSESSSDYISATYNTQSGTTSGWMAKGSDFIIPIPTGATHIRYVARYSSTTTATTTNMAASRMMLEEGNVATSWSPSYEDSLTGVTVTYYQVTTSGTTAPTYTSGSTLWVLTMPTYSGTSDYNNYLWMVTVTTYGSDSSRSDTVGTVTLEPTWKSSKQSAYDANYSMIYNLVDRTDWSDTQIAGAAEALSDGTVYLSGDTFAINNAFIKNLGAENIDVANLTVENCKAVDDSGSGVYISKTGTAPYTVFYGNKSDTGRYEYVWIGKSSSYGAIDSRGIECQRLSEDATQLYNDAHLSSLGLRVVRHYGSTADLIHIGSYACNIGSYIQDTSGAYGIYSGCSDDSNISFGANYGYWTNAMGKGNVLSGVFAMIQVSCTSTTVSMNGYWTRLSTTPTVVRNSTGLYTITHGRGNTSYTAIGIAEDFRSSGNNMKISLRSTSSSSCDIAVSDDASTNDGGFTIFLIDTSIY